MSKEAIFFVYCIEIFKRSRGLTGRQAIKLFNEYGVYAFVFENYELLHIHGEKYILQDIDNYILEKTASSQIQSTVIN